MEHAVISGVCRFCGAENPAPQTDCIDEYPTSRRDATRNAVKLSLIEHCYASDNDIPWHTLIDTLADAVYRSLKKASKGSVPITVTIRSANRTVLHNATIETDPGCVPALVTNALRGIDQNSGYSITVAVSSLEFIPEDTIELTLRRELFTLQLKSDDYRLADTVNLIMRKLDSWRKNGRL